MFPQLSGPGFEVIPVPFLEVSMSGGGFHYSTVDIHREGDMEDYFDEADPRFLRQRRLDPGEVDSGRAPIER